MIVPVKVGWSVANPEKVTATLVSLLMLPVNASVRRMMERSLPSRLAASTLRPLTAGENVNELGVTPAAKLALARSTVSVAPSRTASLIDVSAIVADGVPAMVEKEISPVK